jgi:hypothetical protein
LNIQLLSKKVGWTPHAFVGGALLRVR